MIPRKTACRIGIAALLSAAHGAISPSAIAGTLTVVTAHSLSISLKARTEFTDSSKNDKTDSTSASQKDIYRACVPGNPKPTSTQGVYVFFTSATDVSGNCTTPPSKADILAIDTKPLTFEAAVGTIDFGDPLIENTKSGGTILTTIKVPATVHIDCNGSTTTADLTGVLNLSYRALSSGKPICPISGSIKLTGSATNPNAPNDLVIDDGSSFKINTAAGGIAAEPAP